MSGAVSGWESKFVGVAATLSMACGDAGSITSVVDTRDISFEEILVPDVPPPTDSTATDTAPTTPPDAADATDATTPDGDDTGATTDAATESSPPDTTPDGTETTTDTGATDPSDSDTTVAPFCGDDLCNGDEDCLGCLDCACPEDCGGDLFLSEYVEGPTGFNKALEITNATGRAVDLGGYAIWKITNGGAWSAASRLALAGTLAPGATFVVCHASAVEPILSRCDLASSTTTLEFNGNDAVALVRQGVIIDAIGEDGADPGTAFAIGGVADATKDHRLVRRAATVEGTPDWAVGATEWQVLDYDTVGLGSHAVAATCAPKEPRVAFLNELRVGAGASDYIEIVAGATAADLAGWRIVTTGGQVTLPSGAGATLPAHGFRAITRAELGFGVAPMDIVWLLDADDGVQDVVAYDATTLGDDQTWGRLPDKDGAFQGLSLATPGAANRDPDHICGDTTCDDDEDCVSCDLDCGACRPEVGELVVSEILAEPTSGPEWLEIINVAAVPLELAGTALVDDGTDFYTLAPVGGSLLVAPGERVVLGSAAAAHVDLVYSAFGLDGAGDEVVLLSDGEPVDRVAWASAPTGPGVAWSLDPSATTATGNDVATAWCAATTAGPGAQLGTPGAANPTCVTSSCDDDACDPDEDCTSCPQDCGPCAGCASNLFISEYVEGESGSNKKAIEIANFTGADVNLGLYTIKKISNGGLWSEADTLALVGTLPSGQVHVVCSSTSIAAMLLLCDQTSSSQALSFNGNDAVGLSFGATIIDAIGEETAADPTPWTVAGVARATEDHVLVRKPGVAAPTTTWATSAAEQWNVLAPSEYTGLGGHVVDYTCAP